MSQATHPLSTEQSSFGFLSRTWHGLVAAFRAVEATPLGNLLLANVWPAYVFALPLAARIYSVTRLTHPTSGYWPNPVPSSTAAEPAP